MAFYGKYSKDFINSAKKNIDSSEDDVIGKSTDSESPEIKELKDTRKRGRNVERKQKSCDAGIKNTAPSL